MVEPPDGRFEEWRGCDFRVLKGGEVPGPSNEFVVGEADAEGLGIVLPS